MKCKIYFNSLAPGKFEWNFRYVIFQMDFSDWRLRHLLWNCPNIHVTGLHWWSVNVGSGNGLVPSGNKPLPEPMLTQISRHMVSLGHNELTWSLLWCATFCVILDCVMTQLYVFHRQRNHNILSVFACYISICPLHMNNTHNSFACSCLMLYEDAFLLVKG